MLVFGGLAPGHRVQAAVRAHNVIGFAKSRSVTRSRPAARSAGSSGWSTVRSYHPRHRSRVTRDIGLFCLDQASATGRRLMQDRESRACADAAS